MPGPVAHAQAKEIACSACDAVTVELCIRFLPQREIAKADPSKCCEHKFHGSETKAFVFLLFRMAVMDF
jgi:hypothetical protein